MKNFSLAVFTVLVLASCILADKDGVVNTHSVDGATDVAVKGYDVVAYFTEAKPVEGNSANSHNWNGAKWYFSSQENKNKFASNPQKYAPQYGGFCAYGIAVPEQKIDIEPDAWHVQDGNLYLNYTTNTQNVWLKSKDQYIEDADRIWPTIKND